MDSRLSFDKSKLSFLDRSLSFFGLERIQQRNKPVNLSLDSTPKKDTATSKSKYHQGRLIVDDKKSACFDKPEVKLFTRRAERQASAKQAKNNINLEKSQDLDGELSTEQQKIVDFIESLYKYIPARKDYQGYNKDADASRVAENNTRQLLHDTYSWVGQYAIRNFRPFSFMDTKEFKELQDLMLNQGYLENDKKDIGRLKKALGGTEDKRKYLRNFREIIAKQIAKADQRLKEAEKNSKNYEKMLSKEGYEAAKIPNTPSQANERVQKGERTYIPRATEFVKKLNEFAGQREAHEKQGQELKQQAERLTANIQLSVSHIKTGHPSIIPDQTENAIKNNIEAYIANVNKLANPANASEIDTNTNTVRADANKISNALREIQIYLNKSSLSLEGVNKDAIQKFGEEVAELKKQINEQLSQIEKYAKQTKEFAEKDKFFKELDTTTPAGASQRMANEVVKLGKEVEQLERDMVEIAKLADKAKASTTKLKKQADDNPIDENLQKSIDESRSEEQYYHNLEKKLLKDAKTQQEALITQLKKLLLSEKRPSLDTHIQASIAQYSHNLIKDAKTKLQELQDRTTKLEETPYDTKNEIWHKDKKVTATRARNLAEQYNQKAKETRDRVKQYEKHLNMLKGDATTDNSNLKSNLDKALDNARQIEELERNLRDQHLDITEKLTKGSIKENYEEEQKTTITKLLEEIGEQYRKEKESMKEIKRAEDGIKESATNDKEALLRLRQQLENSTFSTADQTAVKNALTNNSKYIEQETKENKNKIRATRDVLQKASNSKDIDSMQALSRAHIVMDNVQGGWASINGVYVQLREIRSLKHDKETGVTTIQWREDLTNITVFGDPVYAKRFLDIDVNTADKTISVKTIGNKYDRDPGDDRSGITVDDDGRTKSYEAGTLRKLVINNEGKHKGSNEVQWIAYTKTMPDPQVLHNNLMDKDKLKNTHRFDLEKMTYTTPDNQFVLPLKTLDFTEISVDPEHGVILRIDKEWRRLPLKYIGNANRYLNPLKEIQAKAGQQSTALKNECIKILYDAYDNGNGDPNKINEAFAHIAHLYAHNATDTSSMLRRLDKPPQNEYELENLKKQARDQLQRTIASNSASLRDTLDAYNDFINPVINDKRLIENIRQKGFTLDKNMEDTLDKNMEDTLNQIYEASHFNHECDFKLLVDPKSDEPEVKCDKPTMRMLVEEYEKYMRKDDLSEKEKTYVRDIEEFAHEKGDIYLNNDIYLIKASRSTDLDDVLEALGKLNQGDHFDNPDTSKQRRQNYEYLMKVHLDNAMKLASGEGSPELILAPLSDMMSLRQHRLNSLACIEKILNQEDIEENLKKLVDQPSFKIPEIHEEIYTNKLAKLEADTEKLINDMTKKGQNPAEYQKKATELIQRTSILAYQHLVDAFAHDPDALRDLDARRVDILLKISDQSSTALNTASRLRYFEQQKGLLSWMIWQEIYIMTLSMGSMRLTQFEGRIGNVFHRLMSEIFNTGL